MRQPDAFLGKNNFLRETLSNLILKVDTRPSHQVTTMHLLTTLAPSCSQSPQTWQTSVALPYVQIEGVTVQWDEVRLSLSVWLPLPSF